MRKVISRSHLLGFASVLALAVGAAAPAAAFDEVHWDWDNYVDTDIDMWLDIDPSDFVPAGITMTEKLQVSGGKYITAYTNQNGATYHAPGDYTSNGGNGSPSPSITINLGSDIHLNNIDITAEDGDIEDNYVVIGDTINLPHYLHIDLSGYDPSYGAPNALTELAKVEGAATAAANMDITKSNYQSYTHTAQVAFGGYDAFNPTGDYYYPGDDSDLIALSVLGQAGAYLAYDDGNESHDAVKLASLAGLLGKIKTGYVSAEANGKYVTNAKLDLSASAFGNMHSVSVEANAPYNYGYNTYTDAILIADVGQFNLMNVSASADGRGHYVGGYSKMGKLTDPINKAVATAVGNFSQTNNLVKGYED